MNIKSIANNLFPFEIRSRGVNRNKAENASADRDPQQNSDGSGQGELPKRKLTPEEVESAIQRLREMPGVKDNNLQVRVAVENGVSVVFVEDIKGQVIRRFPEVQLWHVLKSTRDQTKGTLYNKTL